MLGHLGTSVPLTVTQEQVTYFRPARPAAVRAGPVPGVDLDGRPVVLRVPDVRRADSEGRAGLRRARRQRRRALVRPRPRRAQQLLADFMARTFPARGPVQRSKTCLYTLTPDRDFVLGHRARAPGRWWWAWAPRTGSSSRRRSAACSRTSRSPASPGTTVDLTPFRFDRPALTDPDHAVSWLV